MSQLDIDMYKYAMPGFAFLVCIFGFYTLFKFMLGILKEERKDKREAIQNIVTGLKKLSDEYKEVKEKQDSIYKEMVAFNNIRRSERITKGLTNIIQKKIKDKSNKG